METIYDARNEEITVVETIILLRWLLTQINPLIWVDLLENGVGESHNKWELKCIIGFFKILRKLVLVF